MKLNLPPGIVGLCLAAVLFFLYVGCNPYEAVTKTYSDAVDKVFKDEAASDNDTSIKQVIASVDNSTANKATITALVTRNNGSRAVDDTKVEFVVKDNDKEKGTELLRGSRSTSSGSASFSFTCGFLGASTTSLNDCARKLLNTGQVSLFTVTATAGTASAIEPFSVIGSGTNS
jgi:hypothetical protein